MYVQRGWVGYMYICSKIFFNIKGQCNNQPTDICPSPRLNGVEGNYTVYTAVNWNFVFPLFDARPSKRCPLGVWEAKEAWFFSQPSPGPPRHFQWPSLTECDEPVSQLPQGVTPVLQLGVHQPGEERGSCDTLWLCVNSCDLGSEPETLQFWGHGRIKNELSCCYGDSTISVVIRGYTLCMS